MSEALLIDRLDGRRLDPATLTTLVPARYRLASGLTVNGHTRLAAGEVLLDDGSGRWCAGAQTLTLSHPLPADTGDYSLALDALAAIDAQTDLAGNRLPGPLLPAELGRHDEESRLETVLEAVFARGHLETIAVRPRLGMRYDTALLPVERAHRLEGSFQRHLAAHSECWASRTLSGIVPKRVLARISEDEADRYEHRVYARLLERLEHTLLIRLKRLLALRRNLARGLEFERSDEVDYRLRADICRVWGESHTGVDGNALRTANDTRIERLQHWLRRLRRLRSGDLYHAVPRTAQIGLTLKPTNLLQHDPHYRALRQLWDAWLTASTGERERPVQILQRRRDDQARHERYVGLLLLRAVKNLNFELTMTDATRGTAQRSGGGETLSLELSNHDWHVTCDGQRLVLVPAVVAVDDAAVHDWVTPAASGSALRVPCVLQAAETLQVGDPCTRLTPGAAPLPLSPLDLYAEEAMTALLAGWLWQQRIAGYGERFMRLPAAVRGAWPEDISSSGAMLGRYPNDVARNRLLEAIDRHASVELRERIKRRLRQLAALSRCPECTKRASVFTPEAHGFYARCDCGCVWLLRDGCFELRWVDRPEAGFAQLGRRRLSVPAPPPPAARGRTSG